RYIHSSVAGRRTPQTWAGAQSAGAPCAPGRAETVGQRTSSSSAAGSAAAGAATEALAVVALAGALRKRGGRSAAPGATATAAAPTHTADETPDTKAWPVA